MLGPLIASIPSPSSNSVSLGPVDLRAYGFLIAVGVLAGVWLASRRLAKDGLDPEIIPNMAMWVLPAGIIGARIYFVLTNWGRFADDIPAAFRLWEGGLGIPGGVALGLVVGIWWMRRNEVPMAPVFTAVGLALPLGQIIGRFGNWFNQELYGRPTDLPWGLEIDPAHRLPGYETAELFHPTFAYEILWNIGLLAFLIWIDRKRVLKPGALFAVYLIGYGIGRIWIELFRIDPVNELLGIRLHIWAMLVFMAGAAYYLVRYGRASSEEQDDAETEVTDGEPDDAETEIAAEADESTDDDETGADPGTDDPDSEDEAAETEPASAAVSSTEDSAETGSDDASDDEAKDAETVAAFDDSADDADTTSEPAEPTAEDEAGDEATVDLTAEDAAADEATARRGRT